jgi:hypothetical protein
VILTELQEKLAEAHGLAIAAGVVTEKVESIVPDVELRHDLRRLRGDAKETRARCLAAEAGWGDEAATAMLEHANTTKEKAADLAGAWFKAGTGPLAAWSFLAMGEAGEVAVWTAVATLAAKTRDGIDLRELAGWAIEVQAEHLDTALRGAIRLAELLDADAPRFG